MPAHPMAGHPPWRQLLVAVVALPVLVGLAIMAFAWPSARIQPRDLPVGVVGATPATQQAVAGLETAQPGGFDFHLYASQASAEAAIHDRDVYGAFVIDSDGVTVLEASAASSTVAQLLTTAGDELAAKATQQATAAGRADIVVRAKTVDIVPSAKADPRGLVLSSALLPLTICSIIIASAIALVIGFEPAWRQLVALPSVAAVAGAVVYLIAQTWLGALPHQQWETWGSIALTVLAISSATAGLYALIGVGGLALSAALMVFVGNPFSGATSAPELLPDAVHHLGQWLPPGAGANLLRSTAYFDGNGASGHLTVILLWIAFGLGAVVIGHHTSPRFAAHPGRTTGRGTERASENTAESAGLLVASRTVGAANGSTTVRSGGEDRASHEAADDDATACPSDGLDHPEDPRHSRRLLDLSGRRRNGRNGQRPGAHEAG